MIDDYLNQSAQLKTKTGVDKYNDPIFAEPVNITCRFEFRRKMVRDAQRQQVISEAAIYTAIPIKPDDVIVYSNIEYPVISVADQPDLDGAVLFYEGAL